MADHTIIETRNIDLPKGGVLEVQLTQAFIDRVRQHFGLLADQPIDDDHVRMFVFGAFNNAINNAATKAERPASAIIELAATSAIGIADAATKRAKRRAIAKGTRGTRRRKTGQGS